WCRPKTLRPTPGSRPRSNGTSIASRFPDYCAPGREGLPGRVGFHEYWRGLRDDKGRGPASKHAGAWRGDYEYPTCNGSSDTGYDLQSSVERAGAGDGGAAAPRL